jgi:aryl-alcohol dehydrogenase-like predicted oxidoreductase
MQKRKVGSQGLEVGAIGLGCMGMTHAYGVGDEAESIATIHRAIELGVTMFDTAEVYGPHTNEVLLGKAIRGKRDQVVVATKFGFVIGTGAQRLDGSPANAKRAAEGCLSRLGIEVIDLYYLHRKDPNVPIEDTVGAMKELVDEGKVRYIGLSEVGVETIRRAHKVHPISAIQSEYSLWERGIEDSILPAMCELGIGLVPFSPLGRGYLTGAITSSAGLVEKDFRRSLPRFDDEHLAANQKIVDRVKCVARAREATPAQVALAWVLAQGKHFVPIPGTKRRQYLEENLGAAELKLCAQDLTDLNGLAAMTVGDRYPAAYAKTAER